MLSSFISTRARVVISLAAVSIAMSGLAQAATLALKGSPGAAMVGQSYEFAPQVSGTGGKKIAYGLKTNVSWLTIDRRTGVVTGTPSTKDVGSAYIVVSVGDGVKSADLSGSIVVTGPPNKAPTISGAPSINSVAGRAYTFAPKAADANNDKLTFSIKNKPSWALFNASSGALTGTPATAASYANIIISVSDGKDSTSLQAFNLTINPEKKSMVTVSWTAPTQSTNGTALSNLAGYRVVYGASPSQMNQKLELPGATMTTVLIEELTSGTYYFAVKAYTSSGIESELSEVTYKTVM
jgi:hypothetical protein